MRSEFDAARGLVGRERELARVWARWTEAAAGLTSIVLVAGDPGIGKTHFLRAMAARASADGAEVVWGGASQAEGMPPYLPFLEALEQHIKRTPPEVLRSEAGAAAPILASFSPELGLRLGETAGAYPLPPEQARMRLYEGVGAFVAAIADRTPTLMILDDLHWADSATLDLLAYMTAHYPASRLLVLGGYQEGEAANNPAFQRALTDLARHRHLSTLKLGPLPPEELETLTIQFLGSPVEPRVPQMTYTHSEGNPFFAEELLRGWQEVGTLALRDGRWFVAAEIGSTVPPSILGALRQRISRLAPEVVDQLRIAAIIGRTFNVELLAMAQEVAAVSVEELLLAAVRARLIWTDGSGDFAFTHDKTRECLASEVSSLRRTHVHGRIGLALESRQGDCSTRDLADLAYHFVHSADRARGTEYSRLAALSALRSLAFDEAASHYADALDLLSPTDASRGALLLGFAQASLFAGSDRVAAEAFRTAQAWYERGQEPLGAARAAHGLGLALWRQEALGEADRSLSDSLAYLEPLDPPAPEAIKVLVDLAMLRGAVLAQQSQGVGLAQRALQMAHDLRDLRLEASASRTVGFLLVLENQIPSGVAVLERALELAIANDDPAEAEECCAALAQAYVWSADFDRSFAISQAREAYALRCQQPYRLRFVYTWQAFLNAAQGNWAAAAELTERAKEAVERIRSTGPAAFLRMVRGYVAYQQADYARSEQEFQAAMAIYRETDPLELVLGIGMLGLSYAAQGKSRQAQACVEEQENVLATVPTGRLPKATAESCLALIAASAGDNSRACAYYEDLLLCAGQYHWFLVDRALGTLALLRKDWEPAIQHLEAAERTARRERLQPELGRTLVTRADLEVSRGGRGSSIRARELLGQAVAVFDELGMAAESQQIRKRLRTLPRQPGPRSDRQTASGLTARELQVLRLLANGLSNKDISSGLALSQSTVAKHLTSIYAKLGVNSRAAAATLAIRHGIV